MLSPLALSNSEAPGSDAAPNTTKGVDVSTARASLPTSVRDLGSESSFGDDETIWSGETSSVDEEEGPTYPGCMRAFHTITQSPHVPSNAPVEAPREYLPVHCLPAEVDLDPDRGHGSIALEEGIVDAVTVRCEDGMATNLGDM